MKFLTKHILFEQVIDWNKAEQNLVNTDNPESGNKQNPTDNKNQKKPVDTKDKKPLIVKKDTVVKKDPVVNSDDEKNKKKYDAAEQQGTVAKTQWNLISNAIKFMQGIGNLNYNNVFGYDVEDSIRVINKYIVDNPSYMSQRAAYIDMIMRLLYGDLQSVAKKFPKQFNYFITRNRSSATSIDYLRNIRPYTLSYTGLTSLLWGNGRKLGLDEDEARGIRRSLSLIYSPKFVFLSGVTPKLKLRYNKKQVEDRILYAYDNKIWGDPDGKRINIPKAKSKAKPKK